MKRLKRWLPLTVLMVMASVTLAASSKMTCSLIGKEVETCCCEQQKNGKLFCKLAKREVDECCCKGM